VSFRVFRGSLFSVLLLLAGCVAPAPKVVTPIDDDAFLDQVQRASFEYFLHEVGTNGLVQDRMSNTNVSSTMAAGFQLTSYCVGADRGWISREEAARRVLLALETYRRLPRFHGMFAHYYTIDTESVLAWMHETDDGADVSETGFMMAGVLACRSYFDGSAGAERRIRELATELYEAVEWDWMLGDSDGGRQKTLAWHWSPNHGFNVGLRQRVRGDMELSSMITYLLAIGSPTHPIPADCWDEGWTRSYTRGELGGRSFIMCPPLFAHQYAQLWLDFRSMRDRHADYFRNSISAIQANRDFALNVLYPGKDLWGITFCDGPKGYGTYGFPPAVGGIESDATIAPTGPGGSIVFAPRACISSLRYLMSNYGDKMWGPYGFYDALSPRRGWYANDYVAIDQGPFVMMIENYRSGGVWRWFMRDADVRAGLDRAGFVAVVDDFEDAPGFAPYAAWTPGPMCTLQTTHALARDGMKSLEVRMTRGVMPLISFGCVPARRDFSGFRFLSLWIHGATNARVRLGDGAGQFAELEGSGRVVCSDGWKLLYYELPSVGTFGAGDVRSVTIRAEPDPRNTSERIFLDAVRMANVRDVEKPDVVRFSASAAVTPGEAQLQWSSSGADVFRYDIRWSDRPIETETDFTGAREVRPAGLSRVAGSMTRYAVGGLRPGATCYFAIKAEDGAGILSDLPASVAVALPGADAAGNIILDDFEEPGVGRVAVWNPTPDGSAARSADTPHAGASALRITFAKSGEAQKWDYVAADLAWHDFASHRYLVLWVRGRLPILAKLWVEETSQEDIGTQAAGGDGWQKLVYDLDGLKRVDRRAATKLLLFPEPGKTDCSGVFEIDDVQLIDEP
jgi:hypothetical protein